MVFEAYKEKKQAEVTRQNKETDRQQRLTAAKKVAQATKKEKTIDNRMSAAKELRARFGQSTLQGIVIPQGQAQKHKLAQKKLTEILKTSDNYLDAINQAASFPNQVEGKYWSFVDAIKKNKDWNKKERKEQMKKMGGKFRNKYGYTPKVRSR